MNQNNTIEQLEENANSYSINTANIWKNEQSIVSSGKCDDLLALEILTKLKSIIETKGECDFNLQSYEKDDSFKKYYSRQMNLFLESQLNYKNLYYIEFFFDPKGNCFSFDTPVIIEKNDTNFDFWFALYLRTFEEKLNEIDNFLQFQLLTNFDNNQPEFVRFLTLCLRQYNELLASKVTLTAQEWLENSAQNISKHRRNNREVESNYVPKRSFKLKSVIDFNGYFEKKALLLTEIIHDLRKEFMHESTKIQQLKDILSGNEIQPKNRINWIGSFKELNMFVSILNYDLNKIEPVKNGIWDVACFCFTKNGKEISPSQLSKANGKETKRTKLYSILQKL